MHAFISIRQYQLSFRKIYKNSTERTCTLCTNILTVCMNVSLQTIRQDTHKIVLIRICTCMIFVKQLIFRGEWGRGWIKKYKTIKYRFNQSL